jgi:hypothetical protein
LANWTVISSRVHQWFFQVLWEKEETKLEHLGIHWFGIVLRGIWG